MKRGKLSEIIESIIHLSATKGKKYSVCVIHVYVLKNPGWTDNLSSEFGSRLDLNIETTLGQILSAWLKVQNYHKSEL